MVQGGESNQVKDGEGRRTKSLINDLTAHHVSLLLSTRVSVVGPVVNERVQIPVSRDPRPVLLCVRLQPEASRL